MSAERVVQEAVYAALTGNAPYMALVPGGVWDGMADQGTTMPYTVLGSTTEVPDPTQDHEGWALTLQIDDFTGGNDRGRDRGQRIREARNVVLHRALLTVAGYGLTRISYEWGDFLIEGDEDDPIWHQITRYRVEALAS